MCKSQTVKVAVGFSRTATLPVPHCTVQIIVKEHNCCYGFPNFKKIILIVRKQRCNEQWVNGGPSITLRKTVYVNGQYALREAYGGTEIELHAFLTPKLEGREWSRSLFPWKRAHGTHLVVSWLGPRGSLLRQRRESLPLPCIEPRSSVP